MYLCVYIFVYSYHLYKRAWWCRLCCALNDYGENGGELKIFILLSPPNRSESKYIMAAQASLYSRKAKRNLCYAKYNIQNSILHTQSDVYHLPFSKFCFGSVNLFVALINIDLCWMTILNSLNEIFKQTDNVCTYAQTHTETHGDPCLRILYVYGFHFLTYTKHTDTQHRAHMLQTVILHGDIWLCKFRTYISILFRLLDLITFSDIFIASSSQSIYS